MTWQTYNRGGVLYESYDEMFISLLPRKVENPELRRVLRDYFHIRSQKVKVEEVSRFTKTLPSGSAVDENKAAPKKGENAMFEEFYQKYETQEQEVIALIRKCIGAGHHKGDNGDFWDMTAITLGMVFCNTGKVSIKEGRLKWPVTEEERNSEKGWGRLQQGQICRLKVRRLLDGLVPEHTTPEQFNSWAVIDVLEPSVPCPPLEAVWRNTRNP